MEMQEKTLFEELKSVKIFAFTITTTKNTNEMLAFFWVFRSNNRGQKQTKKVQIERKKNTIERDSMSK